MPKGGMSPRDVALVLDDEVNSDTVSSAGRLEVAERCDTADFSKFLKNNPRSPEEENAGPPIQVRFFFSIFLFFLIQQYPQYFEH